MNREKGSYIQLTVPIFSQTDNDLNTFYYRVETQNYNTDKQFDSAF